MAAHLGRRLLRASIYLLASIAVIYLIGANLILNTGVLDGVVNKKPEKTLIEWESGWTLVPGLIHVEGFRVRGQTDGHQWQIRLGEADVRMSLLALLGRRVQASSVHGVDFHFRQRPRLDGPGGEGGESGHFPPITGLSNPPDPKPEDLYPPKRHAKQGWHLDISGVRLTGSVELWVGDLLLAGIGSVDGGLDYRLGDEMLVPDALFALRQGVIAVRGVEFVTDLDIETDVTLGPFAPADTPGLRIFDHLTGSWRLDNGRVPDIDVFNLMIPGGGLELVDGEASFSWAFDKESAETGSSGSLSLAAEGAAMRMGGRAVSGDVSLALELERGSLAEGSWALGETLLKLDNMDIRLLGSDELGTAETGLWWARFEVTSGLIDIGAPSELTADFRFELKDTQPLLHLFLAKERRDGSAKLPIWARVLPDIENVDGRGRVDTGPDSVALRDVVVDGDDFDVTAWLESRHGVSDGQLYLRYKKKGLGLDIRDGRRDFKILRPNRWARRQPELDQSVVLGGGGDPRD